MKLAFGCEIVRMCLELKGSTPLPRSGMSTGLKPDRPQWAHLNVQRL